MMRMLLIGLALLAFIGCSDQTAQAPAAEPPAEGVGAADERQLPPGFLDAAPEPPTSETLVLSGGMLMTDPPTPDSVLVIRGGNVLAWGPRGETDMPNDSIGMDFRNKWLLPRLPLRVGEPARIDIYDGFPNDPSQVIGRIDGTDMDLPSPDTD